MSDGDTTGSRTVPTRYYFGIALVVVLGLVPLGATQTQLVAVTGVLYMMMFAMSWDVASGYTGQLNLGHAFFIAVGGYTTAILNISHGISPFISISAAVIVSAIAGLVIGIPALRIRGAYLALVTLVAPSIFYQIVILRDDIFKGSFGFKTPPTNLAGVSGSTVSSVIPVQSQALAIIIDYYIAYAILIVIFFLLFAYTRSDAGRILTAIRQDEDAVLASGINPAKHKVFSFVLSAATAGGAGALYVHSQAGFPHPDLLLATTLSLNVLIVTVIGGLGTIIGAMVGALIYGGLQFLAGEITVSVFGNSLSDVMPIFLFVLGMVVVYFQPRGLVPWGVETAHRLGIDRNGKFTRPAADGGRSPVEQVVDKYRHTFRNRRSDKGDDNR